MATLTAVITLQDNMSSVLQAITQRVNELNTALQLTNNLVTSMPPLNVQGVATTNVEQVNVQTATTAVPTQIEQLQQAANTLAQTFSQLNERAQSFNATMSTTPAPSVMRETADQASKIPPEVDKIDAATKKASQTGNSLLGIWRNIRITAASIVSLLGLKQIEALSDQFILTRARIDIMNDGLQTTQELQDRMFRAATETRNSYLDMAEVVTKLGILAGDVFSSSQELVRFTELMNKNFIVGGSSAREQRAAMYQLTQALASGRLQGDEFRSVLENAPFLAKQIAKELNVNAGELQKLGSQWKITPQVIKRAMFNTADEIEARFANMPKTISQIFTMTFNAILQNIQPVITYINRIANYIYDNWSRLEPIFWGLVGAVGTYTGVLIANTIATWAANAATKAFTVTLLGVPLVGIAAAIGLVVSGLVMWINKVGGVRVAWAITADFLEYRLGQLWAYFLAVIGYVNAAFENMQNGLYSMGYSIAYFALGILAKILGAIDWFVKQAVGAINLVIRGLNLIPGVNIGELTVTSSVQEYQNKIAASQASLAAKMAENDAKLAKSQQAVAQEFAQNMNRLESNHMKRQEDIARMQKEAQEKANASQLQFPPFPDSLDEVDTVNKVKSIDLAEEDLQLLRELAEIKYVQNFVKLTPSVAVNATISEKVDINEVVRTIEKKLEDEFYAAAEGVYQ